MIAAALKTRDTAAKTKLISAIGAEHRKTEQGFYKALEKADTRLAGVMERQQKEQECKSPADYQRGKSGKPREELLSFPNE